jgi:hypothetical protein
LQGPPGTGKVSTLFDFRTSLLLNKGSITDADNSSYDQCVPGWGWFGFHEHSNRNKGWLAQFGFEDSIEICLDQIVPGASLRHVQSTATPSTSTAPSKKIRVLLCAPSNTAVDEVLIHCQPYHSFTSCMLVVAVL